MVEPIMMDRIRKGPRMRSMTRGAMKPRFVTTLVLALGLTLAVGFAARSASATNRSYPIPLLRVGSVCCASPVTLNPAYDYNDFQTGDSMEELLAFNNQGAIIPW